MITVNGQQHPLDQETPFSELRTTLGLGEKPVVVEHNGLALSPPETQTLQVSPGDTLEIVIIAAGG